MNESKMKSSVQWEKWHKSGATGGIPEARMHQVLQTPIRVEATVTFFEDGKPVRQTLSLGSQSISEFATRPVIAVVIPGDKFKPGDLVSAANLPKGVKPVERLGK